MTIVLAACGTSGASSSAPTSAVPSASVPASQPSSQTPTSLLPDGSWQVELSAQELEQAGAQGEDLPAGTYTWTFVGARGRLTIGHDGVIEHCAADASAVEGGVLLTFLPNLGCGGWEDTISWDMEDDGLHLTLVDSTRPREENAPYLEAKPWQSVAGEPIPAFPAYLAFGDSWPYGAHCDGCTPFPKLVHDGLRELTGTGVTFINDVTNGGTAEELAGYMQTDEGIRADVAVADIIVIAIGGNDLGPAFDATLEGTCGGDDGLDCFRAMRDTLRESFDTMLTEIRALRAGKPTAIRMVTTSNEFLADPELLDLFGQEFAEHEGVEIARMNADAQCEVAAAHDAMCIDLGVALNGPDLLIPQDVNTQEAMQKVADTILAAGLPELDLPPTR
jgi:lysophospholipase L1-like esterase